MKNLACQLANWFLESGPPFTGKLKNILDGLSDGTYLKFVLYNAGNLADAYLLSAFSEPAAMILLGSCMIMLAAAWRKKSQQKLPDHRPMSALE